MYVTLSIKIRDEQYHFTANNSQEVDWEFVFPEDIPDEVVNVTLFQASNNLANLVLGKYRAKELELLELRDAEAEE